MVRIACFRHMQASGEQSVLYAIIKHLIVHDHGISMFLACAE